MPATYNYNIQLKSKDNTIKVNHVNRRVVLKHIGRKGEDGATGAGIPVGGNVGDFLQRTGSGDTDTAWASPNVTGDKTYRQEFSINTHVLVNHGLNKFPSVTVVNSANDEVEVDVEYVNAASLMLNFSAPFSGSVTCN